jgi:hypothetical protein
VWSLLPPKILENVTGEQEPSIIFVYFAWSNAASIRAWQISLTDNRAFPPALVIIGVGQSLPVYWNNELNLIVFLIQFN